jgi:hypothetical protein
MHEYVVRPHPQPKKEDDWVVLITAGDYEHVVFNAHRIEVVEEGSKINIDYNILHGFDKIDEGFEVVVQDIVRIHCPKGSTGRIRSLLHDDR